MKPDLVLFLSHRGHKVESPIARSQLSYRAIYCRRSVRSGLIAFLKLAVVLAKKPGALILTDTADRIGFMAWLASRLFNRKLILRYRGDTIRECQIMGRSWRLRFNRRVFFPSLSGIIVVADYLKDQLLKQISGLDPAIIASIPTPVSINRTDSSRFSPEKIILMVTRFDFLDKVLPLPKLVKIVDRWLLKNPEFRFEIVGGGTYWDKTRTRALAGTSSGKIKFTGEQTDMVSVYQQSFCLVYVTGLDVYPSVINEAREFGIPVICSRNFGLVEMIEDGTDGCFLNEDYSNFPLIMSELSDSDKYSNVVKNATIRLRRQNSLDKIGVQFQAAIEKLIVQSG